MKIAEGNLNEKQIRYAKTIHSCGDDLIQLINDILDLSKIESGYISTDFIKVRLHEITVRQAARMAATPSWSARFSGR